MLRRVNILKLTIVLPLLAVALAGFIVVRSQQGSGDALAARQRQTQALMPGAVDRVVRAAPDPISHHKASTAACVPLGTGTFRDPWRCVLRYPSGRRIQYQVTVNARGAYVGDHQLVLSPPPRRGYGGTIRGCCIAVP